MDMTTTFDDLETPLSAMATTPAPTTTVYTEPCKKCNGRGIVTIGYTYPRSVKCYSCNGAGKHEFKTSPQHRAKAQASAAARKQAKIDQIAQRVIQWSKDHAAEWDWMRESAPTFEFANSMIMALMKYGELTERQMETVQRLTAQSAERKAKWAEQQAAREATAPTANAAKIEQAFAKARDAGLKFPKLRLAEFVFSPAGASSKNAGALYVKRGDAYLGKIQNGRFFKARDCDAETEAKVVEVAADPEQAAVAYGMRTGQCSCCGRELTNKESIDRGIGPICAGKFGW